MQITLFFNNMRRYKSKAREGKFRVGTIADELLDIILLWDKGWFRLTDPKQAHVTFEYLREG